MLRNSEVQNPEGAKGGQAEGSSEFAQGYTRTVARFCGMMGTVLGCVQLINKARNHDIMKNEDELQKYFAMWTRQVRVGGQDMEE
jgi:hypothetical protein